MARLHRDNDWAHAATQVVLLVCRVLAVPIIPMEIGRYPRRPLATSINRRRASRAKELAKIAEGHRLVSGGLDNRSEISTRENDGVHIACTVGALPMISLICGNMASQNPACTYHALQVSKVLQVSQALRRLQRKFDRCRFIVEDRQGFIGNSRAPRAR